MTLCQLALPRSRLSWSSSHAVPIRTVIYDNGVRFTVIMFFYRHKLLSYIPTNQVRSAIYGSIYGIGTEIA